MMSLLVTGTHKPFLFPNDRSYTDYQYYTNDPRINAYLNTLKITDELFGKIIHGFKSRKLYNETLFVTVSDYAYVFNDHDSQTVAHPGNSYKSIKQYPRKLTYDITSDEVHLCHIEYDTFESIDLINLYNQPISNHPSWIHINHYKQIKYGWKGR
ncbi:unnamed protein product [Adineta steineri]|uniref:Sulfatase N-terminal domain-containing protein n=1 Tax=Adineta steineri TaxID=433720 RepID=A0A814VAE6_9BILA|nr:unnamed protein product [Adineta steineri]CAF4003702.1 unnamed protein product [Adineta steineri]